jgi:hypothetical protein
MPGPVTIENNFIEFLVAQRTFLGGKRGHRDPARGIFSVDRRCEGNLLRLGRSQKPWRTKKGPREPSEGQKRDRRNSASRVITGFRGALLRAMERGTT